MNADDTYAAVRNTVAWFDTGEEGRFRLGGPQVLELAGALASSDIDAIYPGHIQNAILFDRDGGIVAIVWMLKDADAVLLITEPEDRAAVAAHLERHAAAFDATVEDVTDATFSIGFAGPKGQDLARAVVDEDVVGLPYLGFEHNRNVGHLVARIGYLGEFEYRIIGTASSETTRPAIAEAVAAAGQALGGVAGTRDALPLLMAEMRSLNARRDIPAGRTAIEAGLHALINFRKTGFIGREAVELQKRPDAVRRKLLCLVFDSVGDVTAPSAVRIDGAEIGDLVATYHSPALGRDIGLAYVDADLGWVGIRFDLRDGDGALVQAESVSAPHILTKTARGAV